MNTILEDTLNAQAITVGKRAYPIHQTPAGPVIYGKFSPQECKYLNQIYGVRVEAAPPPVRR